MHLVFAGHRANLDRGDQLGPELQGLEVAAVGQVRPGEPGGEPHVVLDPRAGAGLAARAEAVEDDRGQPLGGTVDGRGEARRARPRRSPGRTARCGSGASGRGTRPAGSPWGAAPRAPVAGHERQLIRLDAQRLHGGLTLRLVGVDPGMRHLVLVEELADERQVGIAEVPEDAHADEAGSFEHDPARLERLQQLVAQVGDFLDDPAQFRLADAVGPDMPPWRRPR